MREIWKYAVPVGDWFSITMPADAVILSVQVQRGQPCIWAMVDPSRPVVARNFRVFGTGHPIKDEPDSLRFVGTFQVRDGALVFHVFEGV